jgi:hypothetical protein
VNSSAAVAMNAPVKDSAQVKDSTNVADSATAAADPKADSKKSKSKAKKPKPTPVPTSSASTSVNTFKSFLVSLGQFIGEVAEAQSSQDISNALDAFALPPGSSKALKQDGVTLGLNAYVNLYSCSNVNYRNTNLPANESGISAPIGFALSTGILKGKGGALSLFIGVIDVGAIFTYDATDTAAIKSTIQLGQVLSPSVSLIYDLPLFGKKNVNIPIEIGGGVQWGPRLRKVTTQANSTLPFLTERWNVFVGFDLPVLHILGKKRTASP